MAISIKQPGSSKSLISNKNSLPSDFNVEVKVVDVEVVNFFT
jgi:hypothetical protein